jgi:UDP-glucose 4-epimerase
LPKREDQSVAPISPYAATKVANELYGSVWSRLFGVETVGLRYFNVFGPRQDPESEYAAVIPRFILWGSKRRPLLVHGDGTQSRDFTYIDNVVSANLLAARADATAVSGKSYNVGCGSRASLLDIIAFLERMLGRSLRTKHLARRAGDVPHTLADISRAKRDFGYEPLVGIEEGLARTVLFFTGRKV